MSLRVLASVAALGLTAAAPAPSSRTVLMDGLRPTPAWFLCDTVDTPLMVVASPKDAAGHTRIRVFPKSAPLEPHDDDYEVGPGDAGMSQVHHPLRRNGLDVGSLHFVSPEVFEAKAPVKLPPLSSIDIEGARGRCRLVPGAVMAGFTARRSLLVIATGKGLTYQSFDFSRAGTPRGARLPTTDVKGGRSLRRGAGVEYRFDKGGYTYAVSAPGPGVAAAATLTVLRGGRLVQSEPLIAYSVVR